MEGLDVYWLQHGNRQTFLACTKALVQGKSYCLCVGLAEEFPDAFKRSVAVLTPYRAQLGLLNARVAAALDPSNHKLIEFATVDGFQVSAASSSSVAVRLRAATAEWHGLHEACEYRSDARMADEGDDAAREKRRTSCCSPACGRGRLAPCGRSDSWQT